MVPDILQTHYWNFHSTFTGVLGCQVSFFMCELFTYSSTPVETLHTILLGPYKYMLRSLMERLRSSQKEEIQARVEVFDFSGFDTKLSYNLCRHFRSFAGRDFKAIAQCGLFILGPYMAPSEKLLWLSLSKVAIRSLFYAVTIILQYSCRSSKLFIASLFSTTASKSIYQQICQDFVSIIKQNSPELPKKVKIHLLLHLVQSMSDFGPTSAFNTERYNAVCAYK